MRNRWMSEISAISGVESVLMVSAEGDLLENTDTRFDLPVLERIARHVMRIIAVLELAGDDVREIELVWHNYRLLVMRANGFALIVLCKSTQAISLLRITLNVVAAHLQEDKKLMKRIGKSDANSAQLLKSKDLEPSQINLISKLQ